MTDQPFTVARSLGPLEDSAPPPPDDVRRFAALRDFAGGMSDQEKVLLPGLALLSIGCGLAWPPLALIVPGAILVLIALGFTLARTEKGE